MMNRRRLLFIHHSSFRVPHSRTPSLTVGLQPVLTRKTHFPWLFALPPLQQTPFAAAQKPSATAQKQNDAAGAVYRHADALRHDAEAICVPADAKNRRRADLRGCKWYLCRCRRCLPGDRQPPGLCERRLRGGSVRLRAWQVASSRPQAQLRRCNWWLQRRKSRLHPCNHQLQRCKDVCKAADCIREVTDGICSLADGVCGRRNGLAAEREASTWARGGSRFFFRQSVCARSLKS